MSRCQSLARDSSGVGSSSQASASEQGSGKGKALGRPHGWFRSIHFTETDERKKDNRAILQCNHCSTRMASRNEKLKEHILHECKKISPEDRSTALDEVEVALSKTAVKRPPASLSRTSLKKGKKQQSVVDHLHPTITLEQQKAINRQLLKLLVMGGISFRVVDSPFFLDFVGSLNIN